jgi:hypothetical protein
MMFLSDHDRMIVESFQVSPLHDLSQLKMCFLKGEDYTAFIPVMDDSISTMVEESIAKVFAGSL